MVEDMAIMSRIYAALDGWQADHQATMVETKGKVSNTSIFIFIDRGDFRSYVSPNIVETCKLNKVKHKKLWLVKSTTGTKKKGFSN